MPVARAEDHGKLRRQSRGDCTGGNERAANRETCLSMAWLWLKQGGGRKSHVGQGGGLPGGRAAGPEESHGATQWSRWREGSRATPSPWQGLVAAQSLWGDAQEAQFRTLGLSFLAEIPVQV